MEEKMLKCERPGCGLEYLEQENKQGACQYHSGSPVFHEGQKGYTCCNKRVLTFDEFMSIPGCTSGMHSAHREVTKAYNEERKADVKLVSGDSNVEVYKSSATTIAPLPKKEESKPEPKKDEPEELDPPDAAIAQGKPCNHRGCSKTFGGDSSRRETCIYHPGVPIFHETLKQWSCCGAKAMEFDKFLEIEGCKTGRHKFVDKIDSSLETSCRYDWYQLASSVIVSVYAKKVKKEESKIDIEPQKVSIRLKFEDGKTFSKVLSLTDVIDPGQSKIEYLSTKVEVKLAKTNGKQWVDLERR